MSFTNLIPWSRKKALPARREAGAENDPFSLMQNEMNRMFDAFHENLSPWRHGNGDWTPLLNVAESEKEVTVTAELPGMDEKDIDVGLSENILTIKGEKKIENETKEKNFHRIERSYGSFSRSVQLPTEIDPERVEAKFAKGVLTVKLAKTMAAQQNVRRIDVKSE